MHKLILVFLLIAQGVSFANGIIIPIPPPQLPPLKKKYLFLEYHNAELKVDSNILRARIEEVFRNPNPYDIEGEFLFPLPKGAVCTKFGLFSEGEEIEGKIWEKEEARKIYESIVRKLKDPGLLEYYENNLFKAKIFPIPKAGTKAISFQYQQLLDQEGAVAKLIYPLPSFKLLGEAPIKLFSIKVRIISPSPIVGLYSPTCKIKVKRNTEYDVEVSVDEEEFRPRSDFILYISYSEEALGVHSVSSLPSFGSPEKDGYFFFLLTPTLAKKEKQIRKNIIFILDTSGSMRGKKIEQAKEALIFCLNNLQDEDKFNIITFSNEVNLFFPSLVTKERIELATQKIKEIKAEGGTNIYEALLAALEEYSSGEEAKSPSFILFLTDGLPTVGKIIDAPQILEEVNKLNKDLNIRIFTFGVGKDVNTHFLTDLAKFNHAAVSFIEPEEENIASTVGQLYSKIAYPALLDVELIFPPYLGIHDTYPKVTDLFWGSHLVIVGRYNNGGSATLIIKGKRYEADYKSPKIEEYKYNLRFSKERDREVLKYLPSLWAAKKISFLMDNLRYVKEKAQQDELIQEIIRLAKLYGIVTPYTSFVVIEEEEEKEKLARQIMVQPLMKSTGIQAFSAMRAQEALKKRDYLVTPSKEEAEKVCYLHDKVFFLSKEGIWIDSSYTQGTPTFTLIYDSPEYYEFIAKYPEIALYFAAGKDMIICTDIGIIKISKQS